LLISHARVRAGGIVKQILKEGTGGSPPNGSNVKAHYTGRFLDGKVFDSSVSRGRPFAFTIGVGQVSGGAFDAARPVATPPRL
jgi:FKBP-type peptidyl-prolyl cis-trans isomerase FkpA